MKKKIIYVITYGQGGKFETSSVSQMGKDVAAMIKSGYANVTVTSKIKGN